MTFKEIVKGKKLERNILLHEVANPSRLPPRFNGVTYVDSESTNL
jgi:hypothetical protein